MGTIIKKAESRKVAYELFMSLEAMLFWVSQSDISKLDQDAKEDLCADLERAEKLLQPIREAGLPQPANGKIVTDL